MGIIIPIFSLRTLTYTATTTTVIVRAQDVQRWREGTILLRAHTNGCGTGSSIKVVAYACAPSAEAPELDFVEATAIGTATVDSTITAPALVRAAVSANFGGWLQFKIEATKGSGNCTAQLSCDFSGKE